MSTRQLGNEPQAFTFDLLDLLDNLPGMIYRGSFDERRTMYFVSGGCLDLTGYRAEELIGEQGPFWGELIHPEDQAGVQDEIAASLREGRPYEYTYRLISSSGEEQWIWESGQGVFDQDGNLLALEGYLTDVTEKILTVHQLEQRAADHTRKLSALYEILGTASTPTELSTTLDDSIQRVLIAAKGNAAFIHLRERTGKTLRLVSHIGLSDQVVESITNLSTQDGLVAWVAKNKEPLIIPHINEDTRAVYLAAEPGLEVYIGVPIAKGARVWGTLSIMGSEPSQFKEEEIALLISIGEEIGMIVENARLRRQAERLVVIQERNRLARELHDSVTQSLYSLTLFAEAGRRTALSEQMDEAAVYFTQIGETGQQALKEMRLLVHKLRPSILSKEGLVRALKHRLNAVEGRAGVKFQLTVEGDGHLSPALEETLYYIAQEALNNSLKHAMASEVAVKIVYLDDSIVELQVKDNGRGFNPGTAIESDGLGLLSMQERAEFYGGKVTINSTLGKGASILVRLRDLQSLSGPSAAFDVEDLP